MSTRDFCWEAMVEVTGANPDEERGAINAALKAIRKLEPELAVDNYLLSVEIHERAKLYHETMGEGVVLTPSALAKHWVRVLEQRPKPATINPPATHDSRGCVCGGDKIVFVGTNAQGHDETAPCPTCNADAKTDFWRHDGTRFRIMDPATVRMRMNG